MASNHYASSFQYDTKLLTKRGHNRLMNDLHRHFGERHKRNLLPKHFQNVPETRPTVGGYHYRRRFRSWRRFKLKVLGHTKPNVFSGELEIYVTGGSIVRATKSRYTVKAISPFPMTKQHRSEIEIMSKREIIDTRRRMQRLYPRAAKLPKYQEFRRQRIRS